jgi:iron complex outermembrane receptor protein
MKKLAILSFLICAGAVARGEESIHLGETVVTSMGFETTLLDEPTNISVITKEKIEEKNYKNVIEALDDNPMINIVNSRNGAVIDMRGSGDSAMNNVKILVDGVAINPFNPTRKGLGLETIPMSNVERIEISPGGGAVLYGNGVSGGVVNIITKSGGYTGGYVESDIDSFNNKKFSTGGNYQLNDKISFGMNYAGQNNGEFREEEKGASDYIDGNIQYKLSEKHKFGISASRYVENETTSGNALQRDIKLTNGKKLSDYGLETLEQNRKAKGLTSTDRNITKENVTGKYEYTPNKDFTLGVTAYNTNMYNRSNTSGYSLSEDKDSNKKPLGTYTLKPTSSSEDFREETTGLLLKTTTNYEYGSIIIGLDSIRSNFEGKTTSNSKGKVTNSSSDYKKELISPYILNKYNLTENLEFIAGYRYEWADYNLKSTDVPKRESTLENKSYEGTLSYKYRDTGNLFFRYEKGYMSPTPSQMSDKVNGIYEANDVKSETSDTYEIGIKDYVNDNTFISMSFFRLEKDGEIMKDKKDNDNISWKNLGKTRRNGIEFNMENYFGNLTLSSGFVYIDAVEKTENGNERLEEIPRFKANVSANYRLTSKLDTTVSYTYMGSKEGQGIMNSSRSLTDVGVRYRVTESLTVKAGINNLFNKEYYESQNNRGLTANPGEERSYYMGFKMTF